MMKKYKFEIQNCIIIEEEGVDLEDAERKVIESLMDGAYDEQMTTNPTISEVQE